MDIINVRLADIVPYDNNPRRNDDSVPYVRESIRQFGFKVPVILDRHNVIVAGHTRVKAAKELGLQTVPCIMADDLTDDQIKAFRLADNAAAEHSTWDMERLELELDDIELDMSAFGLDIEDLSDIPAAKIDDPTDEDDDGWYGDERERTNNAYNLDLINPATLTDDFWQMPTIWPTTHVPRDLIGFNYAKTSEQFNAGIHFFIDDYQFERVWNDPKKYVEILRPYDCVLTPDFSLYLDMPMPMKIWNVYRSRQMGAFWQDEGLTVIPTVSWAEEATFEFAFRGIPQGSLVAISTVGVMRDATARDIWQAGTAAMIEAIKPAGIIAYGAEMPEFDYKGIPIYTFKNHVTEQWLDRNKEG